MSRPSLTGPERTRDAKRRSPGQTLAEFGITISLLIVVLLGIFEVSYLIYQQYVAMNLSREGANLILRQSPLDVTESAIRSAQADPHFDTNTRLILSVVRLGTSGATAGFPIVAQRHTAGMPTGPSVLGDPPSSSYKAGADDYVAKDPANDTAILAKAPLPRKTILTLPSRRS